MGRHNPAKTEKPQRERFIEAAREAGCSEDEAETVENLRRIATAKVPEPSGKPSK